MLFSDLFQNQPSPVPEILGKLAVGWIVSRLVAQPPGKLCRENIVGQTKLPQPFVLREMRNVNDGNQLVGLGKFVVGFRGVIPTR